MRSTPEAALRAKPAADQTSSGRDVGSEVDRILVWLDEAKAEKLVAIDIRGKSSIGDYMVLATGRTDRHVGAIADQVARKLRETGGRQVRVEGQPQCDWVLIDNGSIIVHVFRPEIRELYNLEKMWSAERPHEPTAH